MHNQSSCSVKSPWFVGVCGRVLQFSPSFQEKFHEISKLRKTRCAFSDRVRPKSSDARIDGTCPNLHSPLQPGLEHWRSHESPADRLVFARSRWSSIQYGDCWRIQQGWRSLQDHHSRCVDEAL